MFRIVPRWALHKHTRQAPVIAIASCASTTLLCTLHVFSPSPPDHVPLQMLGAWCEEGTVPLGGRPHPSPPIPVVLAGGWLAGGLARGVTPQAPAIAHPSPRRGQSRARMEVVKCSGRGVRIPAIQSGTKAAETHGIGVPSQAAAFPCQDPRGSSAHPASGREATKNWKQNISMYDLYPLSVLSCHAAVRYVADRLNINHHSLYPTGAYVNQPVRSASPECYSSTDNMPQRPHRDDAASTTKQAKQRHDGMRCF